jgi:C-terminal peptidase prc
MHVLDFIDFQWPAMEAFTWFGVRHQSKYSGLLAMWACLVGTGCVPESPSTQSPSAIETLAAIPESRRYQPDKLRPVKPDNVPLDDGAGDSGVLSDIRSRPTPRATGVFTLAGQYGEHAADAFPPGFFERSLRRLINAHVSPESSGGYPPLHAIDRLLQTSDPALTVVLCASLPSEEGSIFIRSAADARFCLVERASYERLARGSRWTSPLTLERKLYRAARSLTLARAEAIVLNFRLQAIERGVRFVPQPYAELIYLDGYLRGLDPHSRLVTGTTLKPPATTEGSIGGLFHPDAFPPILDRVFPDSPAERAGLRPGDQLLAIRGESWPANATPEFVIGKLRGPIGSNITIRILRQGREREFTLTRGATENPSVDVGTIDEFKVLRHRAFHDQATRRLRGILMRSSPAILDLRNNDGGWIDSVIEDIPLFLEIDGLVPHLGYTYSQRGLRAGANSGGALLPRRYWEVREATPLHRQPLVVVIDETTRSSAEILAAILKHANRALVVGSTSFGKGTVQAVRRLTPRPGASADGDLRALVTEGFHFTLKNFSPQVDGLTPHFSLSGPAPQTGFRESDLVHPLTAPRPLGPTFDYQPSPSLVEAVNCLESRRSRINDKIRAARAKGPPDRSLILAAEAARCLRETHFQVEPLRGFKTDAP